MWKNHLVLDLIEKEYNKYFDYIIVICLTIRDNKTSYTKEWIKNDDKVWLIEAKDKLYQWIRELSQFFRRFETLFIIDDIIADEGLDKRRQSLLELAISGRYRDHSLCLLTESYCAVSRNVRRQAGTIFAWYPKEREDLKMIHDENDVLTDDEYSIVRGLLRKTKYACLYIQNEHLLDLGC